MSADEKACCLKCIAKLVDCVSAVWSYYDELEDPDLGAVVVVLEGCALESMQASSRAWWVCRWCIPSTR